MVKDKSHSELNGVEGWLLLLVIILVFIGPLRGAWEIHSEFQNFALTDPDFASSEDSELIFIGVWVVWGLTTLISVAAGLLLVFWRRAEAVKVAIILIWALGPIFTVSLFGYDSLEQGRSLEGFELYEILRSFGFAIIWTAYLMMSERVKNTYSFGGWRNRSTVERVEEGVSSK